MITAEEALQRLVSGNQRFVQNVSEVDTTTNQSRRDELASGQAPFAIVLSCSDSRVPAEMVFDQGLGDLFVVRVAGNVVASSQMGSIEFAALHFGSPLVVVLGHSQCGAVIAPINELESGDGSVPPNINSLVELIKPAVTPLMESSLKDDKDELLKQAIQANVRQATNHLRHESTVLAELLQSNKLKVVGAEYSLETGVVEFFE